MTQDRQYKKVKTYRALKVVFYCLGLPLFFVAVFLSAIKFIGNDPFTGTSAFTTELGFFKDIEILFTSPALYGVWIAFAIWLVIAIVHIVLSKTVKSRRVRMFSMMAVTLVVMMGSMLVMDSVLGAKVDEMIRNAPEGVTISDYKTQLSYYRTISSNRHSMNMTENLIEQVELLQKVYNVEMEGIDKSGTAGNIGNKPVTYKNVIDDEGNESVDISFRINSKTGLPELDYDPTNGNAFAGDGMVTAEIEGKQIIRIAPNSAGALELNGKTYSHYFYVERKSTKGESLYTWYTKDMLPIGTVTGGGESTTKVTSGIYGDGLYNASGLLSDGWVFSLDNALKILQDYYSAKDAIENGDTSYYAEAYVKMYKAAQQRRDNYYNGLIPDENGEYVDPWLTALYNQEVQMTERFSLTRGELDELIAKVGALLGDNALFDYLFLNADSIVDGLGEISNVIESFLGGALGDLFKQLNAGLSLSKFGLTGSTLNTVADILKKLTDKEDMVIDDLYLTLAYKAKDSFGRVQDHLYIGLVRGVGQWYATGTDSITAVLVRNEGGAWVYQGVDGTEFVPNVRYFDDREVENFEGVWAYKDGSGEVGIEGFDPVVKYFIDKEIEVKKDEDGNWIYVDDANTIIGTDTTPVEKYFVDREVVKELGNWVYADDSTAVVGSGFVPTQRYFDALGNEIILNSAGDAFFYGDGTKFSAVKVEETEGEDATVVEKWVYDGVDGTEFVKVEIAEDGTKKVVSFQNGDVMTDMFGNEIEFKVSIGMDVEKDMILDIDFDDRLIDAANGKYAFDFDTLSAFLNAGLNNLLDSYNINLSEGIISTIAGLFLKDIDVNGQTFKGLIISGIEIPILNSAGKVEIDILGILEGLLSGMYSYQSSVIKPVWEFYVDPVYDYDMNGDIIRDENGNPVIYKDETYYAQLNYANYERALYMATVQGGMMGSVLIGDNLGTGAYPSSLGLADLASVQQLLSDLSYQPVYFPLYALRDMLAFLTGLVILFYFASFLMAQKEEDYASGKLSARSEKQKKEEEATVIAEFDALELQNAADGKDVEASYGNSFEEVEEEVSKSKRKRSKKQETNDELELVDDIAADTFDEPVKQADGFDEVAEEPVNEKKSLFGKKKKVEEPIESLETLNEVDELTFDELAEEPVKEKKGLFGKKKKQKVEESELVDDFAADTFDESAKQVDGFDEVAEEPVKEKKSLFGKKKKAEEPIESSETLNEVDEFNFDEIAEAPVKEKKSLFGRKKKKDDIDEDPALPVSENSDEEVL